MRLVPDAIRRLWRPPTQDRSMTAVPWNVGPPLYNRQVTPQQAISLVPVFGSVRLLASQIASLPIQTYRKLGPDQRVKLPATPALFVHPSAAGNLHAWVHRCVTSMALRGNAVGVVTSRDNLEHPLTVEWLNPDHVSCVDNQPSGPGSYTQPLWYWLGKPLPAEDLVHIPWFPVAGRVWGLSPIEACAATISTGVSAQVYTADWFANGAVPPGKFKNVQTTVTQTESDEIKSRLATAIRSRAPLVYGNDWDYEPIAVSANEARFIETMQLNATQIAAIYGIPPEMVGGNTGGLLHYSSGEQDSINFVKFTLRTWLELLEESFSALLPDGQYVKFNTDALLRGDLMTRMNAYQVARNIGMTNINEIRALEEWAPIPGEDGSDYTPLLVQIAAQRGVEAAQIKADESPTPSDGPPANVLPISRKAAADGG